MKCLPSAADQKRLKCERVFALVIGVGLFLALPVFAGTYGPQSFTYPDGTTAFGDGTVVATNGIATVASVQNGALRLTQNAVSNTISSFKVGNLDVGKDIEAFDVTFTVQMTTNGTPGDGWSLNFGAIPSGNGAGDGGFVMTKGIVIAWDTFNNGNDVPSIEVFCNGVSVANFPQTFVFDGAFRNVAIHWDSDGLDITYDGVPICTDRPTPGFLPASGHRFAFSARTGASMEDVLLDDLLIQTTPTQPVETGGPVISEFVADNKRSLEDEEVETPDWIEIYNGQNQMANLGGWHLTNNAAVADMWTLPAVTVGPYQYKIIYASGKNRAATTGQLHTNFILQKESGYLALTQSDNTVVSVFNYGPQAEDISFGESGRARTISYLQPATPGAKNVATRGAGPPAEDVVFSREGGLITGSITLGIDAPLTPGAVVRYTTNNTEPGEGAPIYSAPFTIATNSTVRARVFAPNRLPGKVSSRTFLKLDASLITYAGTGQPFNSSLPIVVLDSFAVPVDSYTDPAGRPFRLTYSVVIDKNPATGRAIITDPPNFEGRSGMHVRGESSAGFQQRQYSWETWDNDNNDKAVSLLGLPAESDWMLYAPWSEKTLMRDHLIFTVMRKLRPDYMAVRTKLCEVFFNQTNASSLISSTYRGVYLLKEKIKTDTNRVSIAKVNNLTTDPALVSGGYIFRKDKPDADSTSWTTSRGIQLASFDPDLLPAAQSAYLQGYMNTFETALYGANFASPTLGYAGFIEPDTFIDAQWFVEWTKQVDGYVFSTYFHKDRGGKVRAGPIWDFNISLGNASYGTGETPTGWLYDVGGGVGQLWYPRLHQDPAYKLQHWDRYWQMRRSILSTSGIEGDINAYANELLDGYTSPVGNNAPLTVQNPVARQYRKYPILGTVQWPNPNSSTTRTTYQQEVDYMKSWLNTRLGWLDNQNFVAGVIYRPPIFSLSGGTVPANSLLTISAYTGAPPSGYTYATGQIYYTTDGTDPRAANGTASGTLYSDTLPLTLTSSTRVKARLLNGTNWSPLMAADFIVDAVPASALNLAITEIMYNPLPASGAEVTAGFVGAGDFEYIEFQNIGTSSIDLTGVQLLEAVTFDFGAIDPALRTVAPGERFVVVGNRNAFLMRYGNNPAVKIAGEFSGNLGNGGEPITLLGAGGITIRHFVYKDAEPWPEDADGKGYSLVLNDPSSGPDLDAAESWRSSAQIGGTPGLANSQPFTGSPTGDSDGDGYTDFVEYGTGSDSASNLSFHAPLCRLATYIVNNASNSYLEFEFSRNLAAEGVKYSVEMSEDLQTWQGGPAAVTYVATHNMGDGTAFVKWRSTQPVDLAHPRMFMRLRVAP